MKGGYGEKLKGEGGIKDRRMNEGMEGGCNKGMEGRQMIESDGCMEQ